MDNNPLIFEYKFILDFKLCNDALLLDYLVQFLNRSYRSCKLSKMVLDQADQHFRLSLHMYSCLYSTVQRPAGLNRGFVDTFKKIGEG